MASPDDVISLLDEDETPPPGEGLYSLKPTMSAGQVARSRAESVLGRWTVKNFSFSDRTRARGFKALVTLTGSRLIFEIPDRKKGTTITRFAAGTSQRAFKERRVLAGHLPLESIAAVGVSVRLDSLVTVSTMGRFTSGYEMITFTWNHSDSDVGDFYAGAVVASKDRWRQHNEVPASIQASIASAMVTKDKKWSFMDGKQSTFDYESPASLVLNTRMVFSPTDAFDNGFLLNPIEPVDVETLEQDDQE